MPSPSAEGTLAHTPTPAADRAIPRPAVASRARVKAGPQAPLPLAVGAEELSLAVDAQSVSQGIAKPAPRARRTAQLMAAGALPPARIPPEALASPDNR